MERQDKSGKGGRFAAKNRSTNRLLAFTALTASISIFLSHSLTGHSVVPMQKKVFIPSNTPGRVFVFSPATMFSKFMNV